MASDVLGSSWHISSQGLELITANNTIKDKSVILKNALDSDLKEIGSPVLSKELAKGNISQLVLQIQKIRNISAPKANEGSQAAPRMLKLILTDGDTYVQAIEISPIPAISAEKTVPGTKVLIKSAKVSSGYVLLDAKNCSLLGGKVAALYEKWEVAKSVQYHNRQSLTSSDGPPAWVNFGSKISTSAPDKNFKSLENKNKDGSRDNTEFDLQRQGAIAEAATGAVKKVFGGGTKQSIQNANNPTYKKFNDFNKNNTREERRDDRRNKGRNNFGREEQDGEEKLLKPAERVSLFDFLEDKLPVGETNTPQYSPYEPSKTNVNNKQGFNNNPRFTPNSQYYQQNNRPRNNYNRDYNTKPPYQKYEANKPLYQKFEPNKPNFSKPDNNRIKPSSFSQPEQTVPKLDVVNDLGNNFEKMTITNSQFASRSLRQHLNLAPTKKESVNPSNEWKNLAPAKKETENSSNEWKWKIGDDCMAKYWEDEKYYNANVTAITDKTCVVKFKGYGNVEEILKIDCLPVTADESPKRPQTGSMEFRRNAKPHRRN